jgi:hypothetical protein
MEDGEMDDFYSMERAHARDGHEPSPDCDWCLDEGLLRQCDVCEAWEATEEVQRVSSGRVLCGQCRAFREWFGVKEVANG